MAWTGPPVPITVFVVANVLICFFNENFPGARLLKLPRLLFISNRSELAPPNARPRKYWCWDLLNPNHQATSWFVQPGWLLVLRFAYLLYFAATLLVYRFTGSGLGTPGDYFQYLTNLSFILFGLSGLLGCAVSLSYILQGPCPLQQAPAQAPQQQFQTSAAPLATGTGATGAAHYGPARAGPAAGETGALRNGVSGAGHAAAADRALDGVEAGSGGGGGGAGAGLQRSAVCGADVHAQTPSAWPTYRYPLLYKLHLLFVETDVSMALFITVFFWGVVHPLENKHGVDPSNPMVHGCHNLFIGLDLVLSRVPLVSYHYQVVLWYGTAYAIVMWSIAAATGHWVYPMMDWDIPRAVIAYIFLPLFPFIAFVVWYLVVVKPREWLGHRLASGPSGTGAAPHDGRPAAPQHGAAKV